MLGICRKLENSVKSKLNCSSSPDFNLESFIKRIFLRMRQGGLSLETCEIFHKNYGGYPIVYNIGTIQNFLTIQNIQNCLGFRHNSQYNIL